MSQSTRSHNPEQPELGNYAWLSLLRAFGLVLVLVYHFFPTILPGGFIGVDVFFVFSGYLITSLLLREYQQSGAIRLLAFYERRVCRLLPAIVFMLLCTLPLAMLIPADFRAGILQQVTAILGWVTNYYEIATGGSYANALLPQLFVHTWTLAVEMQYYLFWGLALFVMTWQASRLGHKPQQSLVAGSMAFVAILLAVASWCFMQYLVVGELETLNTTTTLDPSRAYFDTLSHGYPLLIGSALGALAGFKPTRLTQFAEKLPARASLSLLAGLLLGVTALAFLLPYQDPRVYHFGILATALASAAVLLLGRGAQQQLQSRPEPWLPKYLAERSYSIYLFHWPVYNIIKQLAESGAGPFPKQTPAGVVIALAIVCSVALAEVSYRFFEQRPIAAPERRTASRGRRKGTEALAACCAAMVAVSCFSLSTAPVKTQIEADYEHQQEMLNITKMAKYDPYLVGLQLNPVLLHARADILPESPAAKKEREAKEAVGILDPANAAHTETPDGDVVPILPPGGADVTIIGDSVTLGAAETLQATLGSVLVDAKESRNMGVGADIIHQYADSGQLGEYVVLALFTNYQNFTVDATYVAIDALPAGHKLILVTPYGKDYMEAGATFVRDVSQQFDFITVADWNLAIRDHRDELAPDGMHMNTPNSRQIYANCIAQAIEVAKDKPAKGAG